MPKMNGFLLVIFHGDLLSIATFICGKSQIWLDYFFHGSSRSMVTLIYGKCQTNCFVLDIYFREDSRSVATLVCG